MKFAIVLAIIVFAIYQLRKDRRAARHRAWIQTNNATMEPVSPRDIAELQLQAVSAASFTRQKLMNAGEYNVYRIAEAMLKGSSYRPCPQVSLGEVLQTDSQEAYRAINSKRIDLLIIDVNGNAVVAVEVQGSGHYQGHANLRDAIKRAALENAGVSYLELTGAETRSDITAKIGNALPNFHQIAPRHDSRYCHNKEPCGGAGRPACRQPSWRRYAHAVRHALFPPSGARTAFTSLPAGSVCMLHFLYEGGKAAGLAARKTKTRGRKR